MSMEYKFHESKHYQQQQPLGRASGGKSQLSQHGMSSSSSSSALQTAPSSGNASVGVSKQQASGSGATGSVPMELEHAIGFTGHYTHTLQLHPTVKDTAVYALGTAVAITDLADPHKQRFLRAHDAEVCVLHIAPSGQLIASGQLGSLAYKGSPATIYIWNMKSDKPILRLEGVQEQVLRLQFSPDSKLLAATGKNNSFFVWSVESGEKIYSEKTQTLLTMLSWGPMQKSEQYTLATGADKVRLHTLVFDPKMMQYRMTTGACALPSRGLVRKYVCSTFDATGESLIAGTESGDVVIYAAATGNYRANVQVSSNEVLSVCTLGDAIITGGADGSIKRVVGRDTKWLVAGESKLSGGAVALSTGASRDFVAGSNHGRLFRGSAQDLKMTQLSEGHTRPIAGVAFGKLADTFCTISLDGQLLVWDLTDYVVVARAAGPCAGRCLTVVADSVVSGWEDGYVRCHSLQTGKELWKIVNAHKGGVNAVGVAAAINVLATGGDDGQVRLWSLPSLKMLSQYTAHKGAVKSIVMDNRKPHVVHSCGVDRTVASFDLKTERRLATHSVQSGRLNSLVQRKDGEQELLTCTSEGTLLMLDEDYERPVAESLDPSRLAIHTLSLSPDGRYLAIGGDDCHVKIYNAQTLKLLTTCSGHSSPVTGVQWSPDQRQIVSVGMDCAICVWNVY